MRQIGTQTRHAAAMVACKQIGSTEIVIDFTRPKNPHPLSKKLHDYSCAETRISLAFGVKALCLKDGGPESIKMAAMFVQFLQTWQHAW